MSKLLPFITILILITSCSTPAAPAAATLLPTIPVSTLPPPMVPTARFSSPTPNTAVPAPASNSLPELDGVFQDSNTGISIHYPQGWYIIDISQEIKKQSYAYAITFSSTNEQPGIKGLIPDDLIKFDLAFTKTEAASLEEAAALQKKAWMEQDPPQRITAQQVFPLQNGGNAYRWMVESQGEKAVVYVSYTPGYIVFLGGSRGDPALIEGIAQTIQVTQ
jgi:hypothetical protein